MNTSLFHFCQYVGGVYDPFPFSGIWFGMVFIVADAYVQTQCVVQLKKHHKSVSVSTLWVLHSSGSVDDTVGRFFHSLLKMSFQLCADWKLTLIRCSLLAKFVLSARQKIILVRYLAEKCRIWQTLHEHRRWGWTFLWWRKPLVLSKSISDIKKCTFWYCRCFW